MDTYVLKHARSGNTYEVRADSPDEAVELVRKNWEQMPRMIAEGTGQTRVFERPNGQRYVVSPGFSSTDPAAVQQALSGMSAGDISKAGINEQLVRDNPVAARASEFARGYPFVGEGVDEAVGAVFGDKAMGGMRALQTAMQETRPKESLALNLAGGVLGSAGMLAATPARVAGLGESVIGSGPRYERALRAGGLGAALGGIEGGAAGYGSGTTPEERASGAASGTALGAGLGGTLASTGPVIGDALRNVIAGLRRSDVGTIARTLGISTNAAKVIRNTFDQGGDEQAAIAALQRGGTEAMLADAGPAAQAMLDAVAASGGGAATTARTAIQDRMARTGQAVDTALDTALGPPPAGPRTAVNDIAAASAPARQAAYDAAYSTPINYASQAGQDVLNVVDRIPPDAMAAALKRANEEIVARNMGRQIQFTINPDGTIKLMELPSVKQLDEVKKRLQEVAYASEVDQFGRLTGRGQLYNQMAGELRDALTAAVPDYGTAVRLGGDKLGEERAFVAGGGLLDSRTNLEDFPLDIGTNPSAAQLSAARSGLRDKIARTLGNVRAIASDPTADAVAARQVVQAVLDLSSPASRAKVKQLLGPDADPLLAQIDEAAQSALVRTAMAQNSKTAARISTAKSIDEITAPGVIGSAASGDPLNTSRELIRAVTGQTREFTERQRQAVYDDLARALTEKTGDDARLALAALQAAMRGQKLTDMGTDMLARMVASALTGGAVTGIGAAKSADSQRQTGQ